MGDVVSTIAIHKSSTISDYIKNQQSCNLLIINQKTNLTALDSSYGFLAFKFSRPTFIFNPSNAMTHFLKILAIPFILLSTDLHAQLSIPDAAVLGKMLNESVAVFQVADNDMYADFFVKNAELIDASGSVLIGRKAIKNWHKGLLKDCAGVSNMKREALSKHTRLIRPDLAVVVATTRFTCGDQTGTVAYNCLFRRIDSKWYVETCAIVPVQEISPMLTQVSWPALDAAKKN